MPSRVTEDERSRIVAAIETGRSRADIAREFERSPDTVGRIAKAEGLKFDRSQTIAATKAKQADNRSERAKLNSRLLEEANGLLDEMGQPHIAFNFGGKENTYNEHRFDRPPVEARRSLMVMVGIAVDKSLAMERVDQPDQGAGALEELTQAIREARQGG